VSVPARVPAQAPDSMPPADRSRTSWGGESLPPPQATSADMAVQATAIGNTLPGFRKNMGRSLVVGATIQF